MMQISEHAVDAIESDPVLRQRMADDPAGTLRDMARPLQTDTWIYRGVVASLGFGVVFSITGALVLAFYGKPTPEVVTALGSACVGALAGLLAPSPGRG